MAFLLADNKIVADAGWDPGAVALILQNLADFDRSLGLESLGATQVRSEATSPDYHFATLVSLADAVAAKTHG